MTFLIHTPTSSAKKRRKQKPTKEQRQAEQDYRALLNKWASVPKFAHSKRPPPAPAPAAGRAVAAPARPPSRVTPGGSTARKESPQYTGDKVLGIATMHKSNPVPVFKAEEAQDIAKMRR